MKVELLVKKKWMERKRKFIPLRVDKSVKVTRHLHKFRWKGANKFNYNNMVKILKTDSDLVSAPDWFCNFVQVMEISLGSNFL